MADALQTKTCLAHHRLLDRIRPRAVGHPAQARLSRRRDGARQVEGRGHRRRPRENGLALALDVDKQDQIDAAVKAAVARFGRIDVLVNNAGYGYLAAVEEGDDADIRAMFETNFFGLAAMTRAVLPIMRAQKSGAIVNVSSMGGFIGFPGSGYYAATQIRGRRPVRIAVQGGRAARDQGHYCRARPVPHRLGRPLAENPEEAQSTPMPRRRLRAAANFTQSISGKQAGRSRARSRSDHRRRRTEEATAAAPARQLRL